MLGISAVSLTKSATINSVENSQAASKIARGLEKTSDNYIVPSTLKPIPEIIRKIDVAPSFANPNALLVHFTKHGAEFSSLGVKNA